MRANFDHFNRVKDDIQPEIFEQLKEAVQKGDWQPIIEYVTTSEAAQEQGANPHYYRCSMYEFVLEYALSQKENKFIDNLLKHPKIVKYLHYGNLYHYAKKLKNEETQEGFYNLIPTKQSTITAQYWATSCNDQFDDLVYTVLANPLAPAINKVSDIHLKSILQNPKIKLKEILPYFFRWISRVSYLIDENPDASEILKKLLIWYLPEDKAFVMIFLRILLEDTKNSLLIDAVDILLKKHKLNEIEVMSILEQIKFSVNTDYLKRICEGLSPSHPVIAHCQAVSQFTALDKAERCAFIIARENELFSKDIPNALMFSFSDLLNQEDIRALIEYSIENPPIKPSFRPFFNRILSYDDNLILKTLAAPHTPIPTDFLKELVNLYSSSKRSYSKIIEKLLLRTDYTITSAGAIRALFNLFEKSDSASIELLLNNDAVFSLLKDYYISYGDDHLSLEFRGTLMPQVVGWYLVKAPEKAIELLNNFTEEQRQKIMVGFVPGIVNAEQPTLRAYMLSSSNPVLVKMAGGFNPRFFQKNSSGKLFPVLPDVFKNEQIANAVVKAQRLIAAKFARSQISSLHLENPDELLENLANNSARHYQEKKIYLHHMTKMDSAKKIIASGRIKTRLHITGNIIDGEASKGLSAAGRLTTHAKNAFNHFIRIPNAENKGTTTTHEQGMTESNTAHFVINGITLLSENPHINFLIIGPYQYFKNREITVSENEVLTMKAYEFTESMNMRFVELNESSNPLQSINKKLFEFAFFHFIDKLPADQRTAITSKLTNPITPEDYKLADDIINALPLEWLIPGDVTLKFSYVERIDYAEKSYSITALRDKVLAANEDELVKIIRQAEEVTLFPFVLEGILEIAKIKNYMKAVTELERTNSPRNEDNIIFYPEQIYQIESLVQLILEDLNNERVFVHLKDGNLSIHSTLRENTNRGAAHHAEMAKLHCALGLGDFDGQNALEIKLPDQLSLPIGTENTF